VTRKITSQAAKIKMGIEKGIHLGNLTAKRDWGHAREYVKAMWLMLQQEKPGDYVIATGEAHSVREFLEVSFKFLDLDPYRYLVIDPLLVRPADVDTLVGDSSKARRELGWIYNLSFKDLVEEMVTADLELYAQKVAGQCKE